MSALVATNELLPENLVEAHVVADSETPEGHRLTTLHVTMHRFVLAEFNTHRVFSRNSASSRAIPVHKRMEELVNSPAFSVNLPGEKPGMQGGEELEDDDRADARLLLYQLHEYSTTKIQEYLVAKEGKTRLHKSVLARYLEPWAWHRVIVTSSDWDGFWGQRVSELAQPEIHMAAKAMMDAFFDSDPEEVSPGNWHLPYVTAEEKDEFEAMDQIKLSTARCARVSYLTHDGVHDPEKDIGLWERLTTATPPHASPLEHPAQADPKNARTAEWRMFDGGVGTQVLPVIGNFVGWTQARHMMGYAL